MADGEAGPGGEGLVGGGSEKIWSWRECSEEITRERAAESRVERGRVEEGGAKGGKGGVVGWEGPGAAEGPGPEAESPG